MNSSLRNIWSIWTAGIVLVSACGGALYSAWQQLPPVRAPHLAGLLPDHIPGNSVRDEPLGSTENVKNKVDRALNYDDYVFRIYRRGDLELAVYIAYWSAGKMPIREVAQHTPDRCWTDNGFKCIETRFDAELSLGGVSFRKGDYRTFQTTGDGHRMWVAFWLLAGDERYDFGTRFNALIHPDEWFLSAFKNIRLGRRELYFVRVSANQPLENLRLDPAFAGIGQALVKLGIAPLPH